MAETNSMTASQPPPSTVAIQLPKAVALQRQVFGEEETIESSRPRRTRKAIQAPIHKPTAFSSY